MGMTPSSPGAGFIGEPVEPIVCARHGRKLMGRPAFAKGCGEARSPLYENLVLMLRDTTKSTAGRQVGDP
jgi:hypothetical protein